MFPNLPIWLCSLSALRVLPLVVVLRSVAALKPGFLSNEAMPGVQKPGIVCVVCGDTKGSKMRSLLLAVACCVVAFLISFPVLASAHPELRVIGLRIADPQDIGLFLIGIAGILVGRKAAQKKRSR
jgi:hypothetical protein